MDETVFFRKQMEKYTENLSEINVENVKLRRNLNKYLTEFWWFTNEFYYDIIITRY